jgi:hypothetical protein
VKLIWNEARNVNNITFQNPQIARGLVGARCKFLWCLYVTLSRLLTFLLRHVINWMRCLLEALTFFLLAVIISSGLGEDIIDIR